MWHDFVTDKIIYLSSAKSGAIMRLTRLFGLMCFILSNNFSIIF